MKRFLALLFVLLSGAAYAQPPQEVAINGTIHLMVGQARIFEFDQRVAKLVLTDNDIANVVPESDRSFSFLGLKEGQVIATAFSDDGKIVHRMRLAVSLEGSMVKIYGNSRKARDYDAYLCTEFSCGRRDPDLEPVPFSTTISETKQQGGSGNSMTTSREYR